MHNDCFQPPIYKNNNFVSQSVEAIYKSLLDKKILVEKRKLSAATTGERCYSLKLKAKVLYIY